MVINGDLCYNHKKKPAKKIPRELPTRCVAFCYGKKRDKKQCKNTVIVGILCHLHKNNRPDDICENPQSEKIPAKKKTICRGFVNRSVLCTNSTHEDSDYCYMHIFEQKDDFLYRCEELHSRISKGKCGFRVYNIGDFCTRHSENEEEKEGFKRCAKCKIRKRLREYTLKENVAVPICKECENIMRRSVSYPKPISGTQICTRCNIPKDISEFRPFKSVSRGTLSYCRICEHDAINKRESTLDGFINKIFIALEPKIKARRKDLEISITKEMIINLYHKQNGLCAKTGIKMTRVKEYVPKKLVRINPKHYYNISIDRIDSRKGYTENNIQLVCVGYNLMKWEVEETVFIQWCHKVSNHAKAGRPSPDEEMKLNMHSRKYIRNCFVRLNDRKIKISFEAEDLFNKYEECRGVCYYTGVKLKLVKSQRSKDDHFNRIKANYPNYSIDRTDSSGWYSLDNIQQVCNTINIMKGEMAEDMFIEFCTVIANNNSTT